MNDPATTSNTSTPVLGQVNRSTKTFRYSVYHWPSLYGTPKHFRYYITAWLHAAWHELSNMESFTDIVPYGYYEP